MPPVFTAGNVSLSQTLTDDDDLFPAYINELREAATEAFFRTKYTVGQALTDFVYGDYASKSACINAAVVQANADGGGTVTVLDTDVEITTALTPRSHVKLRGLGDRTTRFYLSASNPGNLFLNTGTVSGEKYVEGFVLEDMVVDMGSKQCGGMQMFYFHDFFMRRVWWKNVLCGSGSKWTTKFGTIASFAPDASYSTGLFISDCRYTDNYGRTLEQILCTNVRGGYIKDNYFENNTAIASSYDEISVFIYCDGIDVHGNRSTGGNYHGIGAKESNYVRIHDNTVQRTGYQCKGVRVWNTLDCSVYENNLIFPDPISATATITLTNTVTLTDGNTTANFYVGMPVFSANIPEHGRIASVIDNTSFTVNNVATNAAGVNVVIGHNCYGIEHADRNIGFDLQPQRNIYTKGLSIHHNKLRNVYYGIFSGLASNGTDKTVTASLSGTTITITSGDTTNMFVNERMYGTGVPDACYIVSIDDATHLTVSDTLTTGTGISVFFDSNTITYRSHDVDLTENKFYGVMQNAVKWGVNSMDTLADGLRIWRNVVGSWRGSGDCCISVVGDSTNAASFTNVIIVDNVIGANIEGTDNGAIAVSGVTVEKVFGNIVPSYGTRGRIFTSGGTVIKNTSEAVITYTVDKTLSFEDVIFADATSGTRLIKPADPTVWIGKVYTIIKIDSSTNIVSVDPFSTYLINGVSAISLTRKYDSVTVKSDGTQWVVIARSTDVMLPVQKLTTSQKNAVTAVNGMMVYDTTLNKFQGYENGAWTSFI